MYISTICLQFVIITQRLKFCIWYRVCSTFQPTSLIFCLLKSIEILGDFYLRKGVLLQRPVQVIQHANHRTRFSETLLHDLVSQIECSKLILEASERCRIAAETIHRICNFYKAEIMSPLLWSLIVDIHWQNSRNQVSTYRHMWIKSWLSCTEST